MNINGYNIIGELNNANSGFSKWGFATKGRTEYFIKELINPVYPIDRSVMTPELFESRRKFCMEYENRNRKLYGTINTTGYGSLVRAIEFFRYGSHYYIVTEKVEGNSVPIEVIARQSQEDKALLLKTITYGFACLHCAHIAHFDVKPNNILVKRTRRGKLVGKIIDFDTSFFVGEDQKDFELGGDLTYLAPETFLAISGEDVHPDEKADIFALGLVFHQYYTGQLPIFDTREYEYPFEVALDGGKLEPNKTYIPVEIQDLIRKMLDADPKMRPSAQEIMKILTGVLGNRLIISGGERSAEAGKSTLASTPVPSVSEKRPGEWFSTAGDL